MSIQSNNYPEETIPVEFTLTIDGTVSDDPSPNDRREGFALLSLADAIADLVSVGYGKAMLSLVVGQAYAEASAKQAAPSGPVLPPPTF